MSDILLSERRGVAMVLTMNRHDKYNALSNELLQTIGDTVKALDQDDEVRAIILTGTDKFFSTGADLKSALEATNLPSTQTMLSYFDHCNRRREA